MISYVCVFNTDTNLNAAIIIILGVCAEVLVVLINILKCKPMTQLFTTVSVQVPLKCHKAGKNSPTHGSTFCNMVILRW